MNQTQQSACQNFGNITGELRGLIRGMDIEIQKAVASGEYNPQVAILTSDLRSRMEAFQNEYQEKVVDMLFAWFSNASSTRYTGSNSELTREEVRDNSVFERSGRVVYGRMLLSDIGITGAWFTRTLQFNGISYFPSVIRKIIGGLEIENSTLEHLDFLEEVDGLQITETPNLESAARLKKVDGNLDLKSTKLPSLEYVGGFFRCSGEVSAPLLETIDGIVHLGNTDVLDMSKLRVAGKGFDLRNTRIHKPFSSLEEIGESIWIEESGITNFRETFPKLKKIGTDPQGDSVIINSSDDVLRQIKQLQEEGSLQLEGVIRVT